MEYNFETSCSKTKLADIRSFVRSVLKEHQIADVDINSMVLAVEEVVANLIIHSHNCNPREIIKLNILIEKNQGITFKIIDKGVGFNISEYKEPSINEIIRQKKKGGIGLILVKRIMDDVEYINNSSHNVYRLYKKMQSPI